MARKALLLLPVLLSVAGMLPASASTRATTVTAVVVKSWGNCTSTDGLIWDDLNANWSAYGTIPISIDYANPDLCGEGPVTLSALEASGADVVILSDPTGWPHIFTVGEARALKQYANEGHNLIGTFLLLQWGNHDNRVLAPLFGLDRTATYGTRSLESGYREVKPRLPLFRDVGNPYESIGFRSSQAPSSGVWGGSELVQARLIGATDDSGAAILLDHGLAHYSIYVTSMPEYNGGTADKQFFYNAIVFPASG